MLGRPWLLCKHKCPLLRGVPTAGTLASPLEPHPSQDTLTSGCQVVLSTPLQIAERILLVVPSTSGPDSPALRVKSGPYPGLSNCSSPRNRPRLGSGLSLLVTCPLVLRFLSSQDTGERQSRSTWTGLVFEFSNQVTRQVGCVETTPVLCGCMNVNRPRGCPGSAFPSTRRGGCAVQACSRNQGS